MNDEHEPVGTFTLAGHVFACFLPNSDSDLQVWTITVTKAGQEVHREEIPLTHRPIFGPDVSDIDTRDARIEEIIKELGLDG